MFIATREPLWVGAQFVAHLLSEDPVHLPCVVRQVVPGRGMGVEFQGLTNSSCAKLEKLFAALAEK